MTPFGTAAARILRRDEDQDPWSARTVVERVLDAEVPVVLVAPGRRVTDPNGWRILLPVDVAVAAGDVLEVAGTRWTVERVDGGGLGGSEDHLTADVSPSARAG